MWRWGDTLNDSFVNATAGFGDSISTVATMGIYSSKNLRNSLDIGGTVNQCSTAYTSGSTLGYAFGAATLWSAGLNGGANSVFWSGYAQGARRIAENIGTTLEKTPIGGSMLWLQETAGINLPNWLWQAASGTFAANAKGTATAVILSTRQASIWTHVESPILSLRGIPIMSNKL